MDWDAKNAASLLFRKITLMERITLAEWKILQGQAQAWLDLVASETRE